MKMSTCVKVSGVPKLVNPGKIARLVSEILSIHINDIYVQFRPCTKPVKDAIITLPSPTIAQLALERLDNYVFNYASATYVFTTSMMGQKWNAKGHYEKPKQRKRTFEQQSNRHQNFNMKSRDYQDSKRARTHHRADTSHLDIRMEILRKERLILQEKARLMEEQKKLDRLKMESLQNQNAFNRTYNQNRSLQKVQRGQSSIKNLEIEEVRNNVDTYYKTLEILIRKMDPVIQKSPPEEHDLLLTLLRSALNKRIAHAVGGRPVYEGYKIIKLYRSKYPVSGDKELIREILRNIDQSTWPEDDVVLGIGASTEEAIDDNATGETYNGAADYSLQEDTTMAEGSYHSGYNQHEKFLPKKLNFYKASTWLIRDMQKFIEKHSEPEKRKQFFNLLRATLRKRLAAAVEGHEPTYETKKITNMYRLNYPASEDEDFIKELVKHLNEGTQPVVIEASAEQATAEDAKSPAMDKSVQKDNEESYSGLDKNSPSTSGNKIVKKKMPSFYQPLKVLIRKMNVFMDKHSPPEIRKALVTLLRSKMKQRLTDALGSNPTNVKTHKILKLYRLQHPITKDEDFIKELVKFISENDQSDDTKVGSLPEETNDGDGLDKAKDHNQLANINEIPNVSENADDNENVAKCDTLGNDDKDLSNNTTDENVKKEFNSCTEDDAENACMKSNLEINDETEDNDAQVDKDTENADIKFEENNASKDNVQVNDDTENADNKVGKNKETESNNAQVDKVDTVAVNATENDPENVPNMRNDELIDSFTRELAQCGSNITDDEVEKINRSIKRKNNDIEYTETKIAKMSNSSNTQEDGDNELEDCKK